MDASPPDDPLNPVRYQLRVASGKSDSRNPLRTGIHTRGYLPHVKREGAQYFVTFRLHDSLPLHVILAAKAALRSQGQASESIGTKESVSTGESLRRERNRNYFRIIESHLDTGLGNCHLSSPRVAEIVAEAIQHFNGDRYHLGAWVIMPNHVHAVVWPIPNHLVSSIIRSWKGYSARQINSLLDRTGEPFWQPETYDHWIRDDNELDRITRYIIQNPVKAKLCSTPEDWRWSSAWRGAGA